MLKCVFLATLLVSVAFSSCSAADNEYNFTLTTINKTQTARVFYSFANDSATFRVVFPDKVKDAPVTWIGFGFGAKNAIMLGADLVIADVTSGCIRAITAIRHGNWTHYVVAGTLQLSHHSVKSENKTVELTFTRPLKSSNTTIASGQAKVPVLFAYSASKNASFLCNETLSGKNKHDDFVGAVVDFEGSPVTDGSLFQATNATGMAIMFSVTAVFLGLVVGLIYFDRKNVFDGLHETS